MRVTGYWTHLKAQGLSVTGHHMPHVLLPCGAFLLSQGTLRDALDKRRLPRLCGTPFPHPSVVFSLCHDITAALLHLHTEGIV
jgi:hypothetical protein